MPMFCCGVPPGLTMNVLVWGKENSYFWRIYSLGICFGQDPVSMNMPKAKILMDSFEEQDWALLLHPWRIAVPHMSPWGRGLAWTRTGGTGLVRAMTTGQGSAETHNRPDLLTALKGSASQAEVATFCVVNHQNLSELMVSNAGLGSIKKSWVKSWETAMLNENNHETETHTCFSTAAAWFRSLITAFTCYLQVFLSMHEG